ncbi:hypothetical protein ABK040_002388 [Willaertia magna]
MSLTQSNNNNNNTLQFYGESMMNTFSSWTKTVQNTVQNTLENFNKSDLLPTTNNNNNSNATTLHNNRNRGLERKSLMQHQDFSSEEEEEVKIQSVTPVASSSSSGGWLEQFQNIKSKLLNEEETLPTTTTPKTSNSSNSKPSSPTPKNTSSSSAPTSYSDSFLQTFSSIKSQASDKWSQFFDNNQQTIIDENDNSYLGRLSKEIDGIFTLTAKQRMYGFFLSLGLGLLCIIIALGFLPTIIFASKTFAFFYTLGNLLCLISTLFLVGPIAQFRNMLKPERYIPSIMFLASMVLTLVCVFAVPVAILVIFLVIIQAISLGWYIISYIPFAQQVVSWMMSGLFSLFK